MEKRLVMKTISYSGLSLLAFLTLLPFVWMILTALKPAEELFSSALFGSRLAWENFYSAWTYLPFDRFFLNTVLVSGAITILEVATSALAAYAFSRLKFPGRDMLFYLYLGTLMIPVQVILIPQYIIMDVLGWVNTYQGLILPMAFTAFGTFLLRQFFLTIPDDLEEAARMDGCSRFRIFIQIIIPLAKPALATLAVFSFVTQWNNFFWPLVMTNTAEMKTLSVGLRMFQGVYGTEWHLMMAASAIAIIPTLLEIGRAHV